jgi:hypothetical protein
MGLAKRAAVVAAGIAGTGVIVTEAVRRRSENSEAAEQAGEWKCVTVLATPDEVAPGGSYPPPLAELADRLEIVRGEAPGGKGTEIYARIRDDAVPGKAGDARDLEKTLRAALRDAKSIIETGEVLSAVPRPHGPRPATPAGILLDAVEDDAKGRGVL